MTDIITVPEQPIHVAPSLKKALSNGHNAYSDDAFWVSQHKITPGYRIEPEHSSLPLRHTTERDVVTLDDRIAQIKNAKNLVKREWRLRTHHARRLIFAYRGFFSREIQARYDSALFR